VNKDEVAKINNDLEQLRLNMPKQLWNKARLHIIRLVDLSTPAPP